MIERTRTAVLGLVILSLCGGVALGHGVHATPTPAHADQAQGDQAPAAAEREQTLPLPSGTDFLVPLQTAFSTADAESDETVQFSTLYHWRVTGGQIIVHFNADFLSQLGLEVQEIQATALPPQDRVIPLEPPFVGFAIQPDSTFEFQSIESVFEQFNGGELQFSGGFTLTGDGLAAPIHDFSISEQASQRDGMDGTGKFALVTAAEHGMTELVLDPPSIVDVDFAAQTLILSGLGVSMSDGIAAQLDRPELAGQLIGVAAVLANVEIIGTEWVEPLETASAGSRAGIDVILGILSSFTDVARTGAFPDGINGCSMATTSCNAGSVIVAWEAAMDEDHPGIAMNLYRDHDGRFEQIGASDVKHGFFALSNNQCNFGCPVGSDGTYLAVGCSDTYGVGNNSSRTWLGPRDEWNPFDGTWECTGSHFSGGVQDCARRHSGSGHGPTDHMVEVKDADLDLAGATYYYEAFYLVEGDSKLDNNIGSRRVTMFWTGSSWTFNTPSSGNALTYQPTIYRWGDGHWQQRTNNGLIVLAWQTTDLGDGNWRYNYSVFNWTHNKGLRTFRIPLPPGVVVSNAGMSHYDSPQDDWTIAIDSSAIEFTTPDIGESGANPMGWATSNAFWYDADSAPEAGSPTMDVYDPLGLPVADPAVVVISADSGFPVPSAAPIVCSCGDLAEPSGGNVTLVDFAAFSVCFAADIGANPQCTCSDLNGDQTIDLNDFNTFSLLFGSPVNGLSPPNCLSP